MAGDTFAVDCMAETLEHTTIGSLRPGRRGQPGAGAGSGRSAGRAYGARPRRRRRRGAVVAHAGHRPGTADLAARRAAGLRRRQGEHRRGRHLAHRHRRDRDGVRSGHHPAHLARDHPAGGLARQAREPRSRRAGPLRAPGRSEPSSATRPGARRDRGRPARHGGPGESLRNRATCSAPARPRASLATNRS